MIKEKLQTIPLNKIRVDDAFWNRYTSLVTKEILPYQWKALNDEAEGAEPSHCMKNFRVAAGIEEGTFEGQVFQDTDLAKWLEAAAYSLSYEKDAELEKLADAAIDLIEKAQEKNGYLDTYFSILEPGKQFKNLKEGHELYTAGHFIEAAVAYYKVTGKDKLLRVMRRTADLICEVFHTPRYENAVPGHEEIELALMKLYDVTGEERYRQMAYDFVNRRGTEPNYLYNESKREDFVDVWHDRNPYINEYGQNHLPVRMQKKAEGHAVRAVYLYCAMADLAYACKDETLFNACVDLYQNIIKKRMYITGGIGSSGMLERFTADYDLPNDTAYCESCASIGLALFCRRMAQITGDASYVDTMEIALANTVLAGIAMDGKSFFYVNPLEVWPESCIPATDKNHVKPVRQKWFGCACCPPNIARTLASLGEYNCFTADGSIWLNLIAGGKIEAELNGEPVSIAIESRLPYEGDVKIKISSESSAFGKIMVRVPSYAKNAAFTVDGQEIEAHIENGYAILENTWKNQSIELKFDMAAHFVYANPRVRENVGKAAVMRGALVYCLEEADNGENLSALYVDTAAPLLEEFKPDLLGGTVLVRAKGKRVSEEGWEDALYCTDKPQLADTELVFVPYHSRGNRERGELATWVKTV